MDFLLIVIFFRYARLILGLVEYWCYRKLAPFSHNTSQDDELLRQVTIVSITLGTEPRYRETISQWLTSNPSAIIIITIKSKYSDLVKLIESYDDSRISLHWVETPSARLQYAKAVQLVKTPLFVIADDRSRWMPGTLNGVLRPLSNTQIGGATVFHGVAPMNDKYFTPWELFGLLNIHRRNVQHATVAFINGGQVLNLSGRLAAFRTNIFQKQAFYDYFVHEKWLGRFAIRTGDDNAFTTWVVREGWETWFENDPNAATTVLSLPSSIYLKQLLRWQRDTARHYLSDLFYGFRSAQKRLIVRAALNIVVYYTTDVSILVELSSLSFLCVNRLSGLGYAVDPRYV
ncbi:hypothetical protein GQX73_g3867 [Xylaria multiplex]|uniref:Uncharacterized protein n=1 Tax=Xylaria multiplex TaxID=323545 RepID=A0A7C8MWD6_9PEZI|nr:hypothetical protein GQX73_g3867 [Xylaria multiplex]